MEMKDNYAEWPGGGGGGMRIVLFYPNVNGSHYSWPPSCMPRMIMNGLVEISCE